MKDITYSNLGQKQKPVVMTQGLNLDSNSEIGLSDLMDIYIKHGWESFSEKELLRSLMYEFKLILEIENLKELAQDLVQIDHQLQLILDNIDLNSKGLGLEAFYQNLSTLFIRMALEEEINSDSMKRAIEIALEEEIYSWQERLG